MYKAEIITVGDEILIGQIVDTNSAWIAVNLNIAGIKTGRITSISDNGNEIKDALRQAEKRADIILITGGLGPTSDDITKKTLAEYFGSAKMIVHQPTLDFIRDRFARRGMELSELNRRQAEAPECSVVIPNRNGTAPGLWFEKDRKIFVAMPGVPDEMMKMFPDVINMLKNKILLPQIVHRTMMTFGIPESVLAETIEDWEKSLPANISLAYLPNIETGVKLRLSTVDSGNAHEVIEKLFDRLFPVLGNSIYGYEPDSLESVTGKLLLQKNATLATAESCTGGKTAHRITSVPGSSAYFRGGIVAYSNEIKTDLLGVRPEDIEKYGAVSETVAAQMAKCARKKLNADYAISITGIAGPDGGSAEKPVGLCWFGIATPCGVKTFSQRFVMDRLGNIAAASSVSLNGLRTELCDNTEN
ncbi:MAG: competence/damage-inducible protein A [Prevotellaceae bacterium]|jgi:nicotinamide-nucleotide amidase|nr:competence/damage-inducible protein A [Prevotellaceae bacterium]